MTELNWKEKLARNWWRVKIGREAEGLRQDRLRFDNVESLTRQTRRYLMGTPLPEARDEDMHIGDQHIQITQQKGEWAKALLGAGLLATGLGLPLGAGLLAHALLRDTPQATSTIEQIHTGLDEDNTLRLTLPDWRE